jgi:hypothetical protein
MELFPLNSRILTTTLAGNNKTRDQVPQDVLRDIRPRQKTEPISLKNSTRKRYIRSGGE